MGQTLLLCISSACTLEFSLKENIEFILLGQIFSSEHGVLVAVTKEYNSGSQPSA